MKSIILDMGNVICYPTTGNWLITPKFEEYIKQHNINKDKIINSFEGNYDILDRPVARIEDEVYMFIDFFTKSLNKTDLNFTEEDIINIAKEITYSTDKYKVFEGVREELEELKKHNKLYMLSDNWPCGERLMDYWDLSKYFEQIYISSVYGIKKDDKAFFQKPIYDHNLSKDHIIFVDDSDYCLDTSSAMGIKSIKMDRYKVVDSKKYPVINNLFELKKHM